VVQSDVTISGGSQVLNVDIGVTQITGTITQNGGLLPIQSSSSTDGLLWAVSKDTGAYHQLHNIDWGARSPSYSRPADDDTYASQLMPGVYDIVYTRNYTTGSTFNRVYAQNRTPVDAAVNAYRVVQSDVTISGGSQVLNVDIGVTQITGTITQNGGLLPIQSSSSTDGLLWAVSKDTGAYHQLHNIDWGARSPSYSRPADDDTYASQLMPGVYDIVYTRNYTTGSTFNRVYAQNRTPVDAAVNAYRVIQACVLVE
ncbi:MAG: hypothetical protein AB8H86_32610, partial [Polyangiales bacterium]